MCTGLSSNSGLPRLNQHVCIFHIRQKKFPLFSSWQTESTSCLKLGDKLGSLPTMYIFVSICPFLTRHYIKMINTVCKYSQWIFRHYSGIPLCTKSQEMISRTQSHSVYLAQNITSHVTKNLIYYTKGHHSYSFSRTTITFSFLAKSLGVGGHGDFGEVTLRQKTLCSILKMRLWLLDDSSPVLCFHNTLECVYPSLEHSTHSSHISKYLNLILNASYHCFIVAKNDTLQFHSLS